MNPTLLTMLTNTNDDIMVANVARLAALGKEMKQRCQYYEHDADSACIRNAGLIIAGDKKLDSAGIDTIRLASEASFRIQEMFNNGYGNQSAEWEMTADEYIVFRHIVTSNVCLWLFNEITARGIVG